MMMEVRADNFEQDVIQESFQQPVIVDFWAPWCGPCQVLGPILDKLEEQAQGRWKLVKINTDVEQSLAQALQIQSLPTVKFLFEGKQVSEFSGAQPEDIIRKWLEDTLTTIGSSLPSAPEPNDIAAAKQMLEDGRPELAEQLLTELIEQEPENKAARLILAKMIFPSNPKGAVLLVQEWTKEDGELEAVKAMEELSGILEAQVDVETNGGAELFRLGVECFRGSDLVGAVTNWIALVQEDRDFLDDIGRRACVALFLILGSDHPVTDEYRGRLSAILF